MYRCPTCVSVLVDATVRRCPVCGENLKRKPPTILGLNHRSTDKMTSWDIAATAEASRFYAQEPDETSADIDLPKEHLRDSSGRAAEGRYG